MNTQEGTNPVPKPTLDFLFPDEWPNEDSEDEDYDYARPPPSPAPSSDEGSDMSGDLEVLAEAGAAAEEGGCCADEERYVCRPFTEMPSTKVTSHSRQDTSPADDGGAAVGDITLTAEQFSQLQRRYAEFRAADPDGRSNIIQASVERIERSWGQGAGFNRGAVETVRALSATLNYSHAFVDCSPILL